jgi:hypothetical protein
MENTPTSFGSVLYQKSVLFPTIQFIVTKNKALAVNGQVDSGFGRKEKS